MATTKAVKKSSAGQKQTRQRQSTASAVGARSNGSGTKSSASKKVAPKKTVSKSSAAKKAAVKKKPAAPTKAKASSTDRRSKPANKPRDPRTSGANAAPLGEAILRAMQGGSAQGTNAGFGSAWPSGGDMGNGLSVDASKMKTLQSEYMQRLGQMINAEHGQVEPTDRRFASAKWHEGLFGWNAAFYELNAEFMGRMADALQGEAKSLDRVKFATQQWVDAMSPANFFMSNPDAQQAMLESGGKSVQDGMLNLIGDLQQGRISQTDETAFEVGKDLAVSEGSVVFENELMQLIQYAPKTKQVHRRPLLMVPPCINKFYILDLQPRNSLVAYLVSQGQTVFMVSWRNVDKSQETLAWDDYLSLGVVDAIEAVRDISGQKTINALGFCVGGTIIATALAALAARGERPVESLTLLTTLLNFDSPGVLNIFIDEQHVAWREETLGNGGIMAGADLAQTFSALRPNDLIWNYVVKNYLKGEQPPAFDLLYWNSDGTNLPGPMFAWYLRHLYLQNELCKPGELTCLGESIDLGSIDLPTYVYGSREDHIVPWTSAYQSTQLLSGDTRFVLGASGHIAGVINPADRNKRNYWVNDQLPVQADDWFEQAEQVPGSWWVDWRDWLAGHSGAKVKAPASPGNSTYQSIEPAPGRYVRAKAA